MQPYYLRENCEIAEYLDVATDIEYPDVCEEPLPEVLGTLEPQTVANPDFESVWDLSLEEAVHTALHNAKVVRDFGQVRQFGQIVASAPERLTSAPQGVSTIYDVAIQETGQNGVEQILSRFDAIFNSQATWDSTDRRQNFSGAQVNAAEFQQDQVNVTNELSKLTAGGAQLFLRNVNIYTGANNPLTQNTRTVNSDWFTSLEAEVRQPLLRGRGAQVNRAAVIISRMRSDQAIIDFEGSVASLLNNVERAYWELYFFYHNLEAAKVGRDTALGIWQRIRALREEGYSRGDAAAEAQAREQYFFFRNRLHEAIRDLQKSQTRLRYLMGLAPNDGRMIRPCDDPTTAWLRFDWCAILEEAVIRRPAVRRQKWSIKQRELELIAARNQLLPQFDAIALYRWLGVGDEFSRQGALVGDPRLNEDGTVMAPGADPNPLINSAIDELFDGNFQEFRLGFEFELPVGMRAAMAQVRNQQLQLARDRARLEDLELEVTHQLGDAIQDLDAGYQGLVDNLDRLNAAEENVDAANTGYEAGGATLDLLLDAHRRRAEAAIAYYQALVNYNVSIMNVHFRKGSIMDYDGVMLSEGPWPSKAYFDATNRARQRSASHYLNYGFSRPKVVSRGNVMDNVPPPTPPTAFGESTGPLEGELIEPQPYDSYPPAEYDSLSPQPLPADLNSGDASMSFDGESFESPLEDNEPGLELRFREDEPARELPELLDDAIETSLDRSADLLPPQESAFEQDERVAIAPTVRAASYTEPIDPTPVSGRRAGTERSNFFDNTLDRDDTAIRSTLKRGAQIRWRD